MKMVKINGKIMEEKLKRGWTISRFAARFEVSEDEFLQALEKSFSPKAYSDMVSRMKKNEKKATYSKREPVKKNESLTSTDSPEVLTEEENSITSPLDLLKVQLKDLQDVLSKKELEHKNLVEQRYSIRKSVAVFEEELLRLKSRISECKTEIEALLLEHENVFQEMKSVNEEISVTKRSIDAIEAEIKEMEKLTVFVYESGDFEITTPCNIDISDSWDSIYKELRDDENLETLTVKQIKTLSKCIAYAEAFSLHNISYEIIFEDEVVEKFFKHFN